MDRLVDENYHFSGKHISEYDRTKAAAHEIAQEFIAKGLPLVIVMPGLIYGPGDTSSLRIEYHRLFEWPAADASHPDRLLSGHMSTILRRVIF